MTMTVERAIELLGGRVNGRDVPSGYDLMAGHANRRGAVLVTHPRRFRPRLSGGRQEHGSRERRPGSGLITAALVLLVFLGIGLLAVSVAAQYRYILAQRRQVSASVIEALALDIGLCILSCLALALSRLGLASTVERVLIQAVAGASAGMNFAAANPGSWRSVLAYTMPPMFLAVIVDRVVSVIRRHYLQMPDVSPWRMAGRALVAVARFCGLAVLYGLRLFLDPPGTCSGVRRAILAATPLPQASTPHIHAPMPMPGPDEPRRRLDRREGRANGGTKTARFLELVRARHGEFAAIPLDQVSRIATAIAPEADLHPASARTALLGAVRAALPAAGGGAR
jgi:hypothetical protein